jgi:hypothetical protein
MPYLEEANSNAGPINDWLKRAREELK